MQRTIKIIAFYGGIFSGFSLSTTLNVPLNSSQHISIGKMHVEGSGMSFWHGSPGRVAGFAGLTRAVGPTGGLETWYLIWGGSILPLYQTVQEPYKAIYFG